jgi:hypothetical protein
VVSLSVGHYEKAEELVDSHGRPRSLPALYSLSVAAALDLKAAELIDSIVVANKVVARVAAGIPD